ncbi:MULTISPECIES: TetR/AcrR family transcriptional regulator [Sphingomonas]|uniref:TetR/AcrR family transcriptional regulator n=1 Tax=Sphingomonas TaxID=13687 RepID=UPI002867BD68|nr:TetR/AcrR family transcriptional regulator [Sphingomonas sp. CGMCC 1.13658]
MAAAREAFFSKGYGATSMSSISATVGGSKTTLWTYFPSKQELFAAVVDDLVERYGRALEVEFDPTADIAESLRTMGRALLATVHARPIVDLHRLCIGEAGRFPELARLFHERAPARGKARLRAYIAELMARGRLRAGDPADASLTFVGRLWAGSIQSHLVGLIGPPDAAEIEREIDAAVDVFLRAWAA